MKCFTNHFIKLTDTVSVPILKFLRQKIVKHNDIQMEHA